MSVAETFYPQNWEVHIANLRSQKNGFQVKFQTQKHGTHTPVCKHGKYSDDHCNHAQGSIMVHSSGTQGTQNYLKQLSVPKNLKI